MCSGVSPGAPDAVAVGDQAGGPVGRRRDVPVAQPVGVLLGQRDEPPAHRVVLVRGRAAPAAARSVAEAVGVPARPCATRPPRRRGRRRAGRRRRNGAAPPARPAARGRPPDPRRPARRPGRRRTRRPAERRHGVGPPLALGVRRPGDQAVGVVDPEAALLPGPGGQRHQPAQAGGPVLAALVEGVGRDPHRVDEADARQERRAAADQVDVGPDRLAHQRQAGAVCLRRR